MFKSKAVILSLIGMIIVGGVISCNDEDRIGNTQQNTILTTKKVNHYTDWINFASLTSQLSFASVDTVLETDYGDVEIYDILFSEIDQIMVFAYSYSDSAQSYRRFAGYLSHHTLAGGCIIGLDTLNQLLIGFSMVADTIHDTGYTITEWTCEDTISIYRWLNSEERVFETYADEKDEFDVNFTEAEVEQFKTNKYLLDSTTMSRLELAEIQIQQLVDSSATLDQNVDGSILISLVQSQGFQDWLSEKCPKHDFLGVNRLTVDDVCDLAWYGLLKCKLGGPANPICVAAVGVTLACLVYKLYLLW